MNMSSDSSASPAPSRGPSRLAAAATAARALLRALVRRLRPGAMPMAGRNDGPPDLDELWRDFNRKLGRLFGQRGRAPLPPSQEPGDDRPSFQPDFKHAGAGIALIVAVIVVIWLGSGFFIVQEGQQAIVTTFGRYTATLDAGFQWRFPYPIQSHETVAVTQLRSMEVGRNTIVPATGLRDSSMLTEDENIVDVRFTVQYRLKNAKDYLFENRDPDKAVEQASESAVREIVGRSRVDQVLYEQRDAIAAALVKLVQSQLDRLKSGILIVAVNLQNVQVPEQVQAAFNDAVKAGADRDRLKNEGQAYASDVIPRARGNAARLHEEALGYAQRVVAQAEGDAQRFRSVLAEYQKAPQVTRDRMYIDTMQQVLGNVSKVMVETRNGSNLLYLPLDKLLAQTAAPAPSGITVQPPVLPSESLPSGAGTSDARSRDNARSRDRDVR